MLLLLKVHLSDLLGTAKVLGAAISTIGVAGSGVGIGIVFGCFFLAVAKHPLIEKVIFPYVILGFALSESMALFALMMSFLLLYS